MRCSLTTRKSAPHTSSKNAIPKTAAAFWWLTLPQNIFRPARRRTFQLPVAAPTAKDGLASTLWIRTQSLNADLLRFLTKCVKHRRGAKQNRILNRRRRCHRLFAKFILRENCWTTITGRNYGNHAVLACEINAIIRADGARVIIPRRIDALVLVNRMAIHSVVSGN